tara:strand:+ start:67 stop:531 length:465 start_codon:yes stop_codon:yes gene_type:complete
MSKVIQFWFAAVLLVGRGVSADLLKEENINDGSISMYSQVTHTGNVVFINEFEEVFYPCRSRDPSDCPVSYPSLGFLFKRYSEEVVELGEGKGFWCKFSSLKMPDNHRQGDNFPINWCHRSGWVEGVKPKSFSNQSNIGEPHAIIMHPAFIEND